MHIDRFDAATHLRRGQRTREALKAAVLKAGGFSVFEANGDFDFLRRDPDVEFYDRPYPWIGVRRRGSNARKTSLGHD